MNHMDQLLYWPTCIVYTIAFCRAIAFCYRRYDPFGDIFRRKERWLAACALCVQMYGTLVFLSAAYGIGNRWVFVISGLVSNAYLAGLLCRWLWKSWRKLENPPCSRSLAS